MEPAGTYRLQRERPHGKRYVNWGDTRSMTYVNDFVCGVHNAHVHARRYMFLCSYSAWKHSRSVARKKSRFISTVNEAKCIIYRKVKRETSRTSGVPKASEG